MQITEENYLSELQRKNEDALEYVVQQFGGLMQAVILRILSGYPEDAEECLFDTVMKIWDHSSCFDGSGNFAGWAAAIAKYTALDRLRKIKRLRPQVDIDKVQLADASGLTGNELFDGFFAELIECLNEEDQALFTRIFWEGETVSEAAAQLGKPKSVLYNRIPRGKRRIIRHHPGYFKKEEES